MAGKRDENKLATGITLLAIGILHLIDKMRLVNVDSPIWKEVMDWRSYVLYAALSFLIVKTDKKTGIGLLILGIILRIGAILRYMGVWQAYLIPGFLILLGIVLIIEVLKK